MRKTKTDAIVPVLLTFLVVSGPTAFAQAVDTAFEAAVYEYKAASDSKAFALAQDPDGGAAWGYATELSSPEAAALEAMARCHAEATRYSVQAECKLVLLGNTLLSQSTRNEGAAPTSEGGAEAMPEVVYSNEWINGTQFAIGAAGDVQVWAAFWTKPDWHAVVYIVNGSADAETFEPATIGAKAIREAKTGEQVTAIQTFSADQYQQKLRRRQAWAAGLMAASASLNNQPQPQRSTVHGYSPGTGSYHGTITTWPTSQDYAAAQARTNAQVGAMVGQLASSFNAVSASLARTHTVGPGTYYGGVVHFEKSKADRCILRIPFAGFEFNFEFDL